MVVEGANHVPGVPRHVNHLGPLQDLYKPDEREDSCERLGEAAIANKIFSTDTPQCYLFSFEPYFIFITAKVPSSSWACFNLKYFDEIGESIKKNKYTEVLAKNYTVKKLPLGTT